MRRAKVHVCARTHAHMRGPERFYLACAFRTHASPTAAVPESTTSTYRKLNEAVSDLRTMGRAAMMEQLVDSPRALFDEDKTLVLDALETQAACGPCTGPRPSEFWYPAKALSYDAWSMLGDMEATCCMELYCEIIAYDYPNWFELLVRGMSDQQRRDLIATAKECALEFYRSLAEAGLETTKDESSALKSLQPAMFLDELFSHCADDEFAAIPCSDSMLPIARYGHLSTVVDETTLYISHGRASNGRLLGDLWRLDLNTGKWTGAHLRWPGSPCDGLASAQVGTVLYAFRGRGKDDCDVTAQYPLKVSAIELADDDYSMDASFKWMHIDARGDLSPRARSTHTATRIGSSVFIFGGVDAKTGDDCSDLWEFNTINQTWLKRSNGLHARSAHVAVCIADRYMLVTGGSNGNEVCSCGEVHAYDAVEDAWRVINIDSHSDVPSPRAGHSAVLVDNEWFIFGGGDNDRALCDAYVLNVSQIADETNMAATWRQFTSSCALMGREGMSANVVRSPVSGRKFIILHGGAAAGKASAETFICRLSATDA